MKKIAILGSTGSIGTQTLSVVREHGDIEVTALAAGHNIAKLEEQIREFHPALVAVWAEEDAIELRTRIADLKVKVASGMEGLLEVATEEKAEILVTAIVGMLGIRPTIAAMKAGKDIALANKETLVTAGHIIMPLAKSALVVVALFTFLGNWIDFFGPIIYLNTKTKFTLAVGLLQFRGDYSTKWNLLMAASTIVVAPCVGVFLVGQKHLIEGISLTGMKA